MASKKKRSSSTAKPQLSHTGLRFIAGFKLFQGLILAFVGTGILIIVNKNADVEATKWLTSLHIDVDNNLVHPLLVKLDAVSPVKFKRLGAGAFLYAIMLVTEGVGLLLEKVWAEYLTVAVTGSFLPWEIYEVVEHFSFGTLAILAANAAVVWYLVRGLRAKTAAE